MDHHEQTIAEYQREQKVKHQTQLVNFRIGDMLDAIQEETLKAGGLLKQKQEILLMPVSKLLEMFARNSIHIQLTYRKPFEFILAELEEAERNK